MICFCRGSVNLGVQSQYQDQACAPFEVLYLVILTSLSNFARPSMAFGVIRMYWRPIELRAAEHYKAI